MNRNELRRIVFDAAASALWHAAGSPLSTSIRPSHGIELGLATRAGLPTITVGVMISPRNKPPHATKRAWCETIRRAVLTELDQAGPVGCRFEVTVEVLL
jgi:hypothetical protein